MTYESTLRAEFDKGSDAVFLTLVSEVAKTDTFDVASVVALVERAYALGELAARTKTVIERAAFDLAALQALRKGGGY